MSGANACLVKDTYWLNEIWSGAEYDWWMCGEEATGNFHRRGLQDTLLLGVRLHHRW